MSLNALSAEMDDSWRQTVSGSGRFSRHLFMAVCFNLLNLISLANVWKVYRHDPRVDGYLGLFLLLMAWFLAMLGYYAFHLYRTAKRQVSADGNDAAGEALLRVSFLAYRLYLFALCLSFLVVTAVTAIHLQ